jgi:cell division protein FtsI (penicillin-binding protein 3)
MADQLRKDIRLRIYLLYFIMLLAAVAILVRIFQIQFIQGEHWKAKSKEQSYKFFDVVAIRGNIYSDNHSLLATSVPIYEVYWDSKVIEKSELYRLVDSMAIGFNAIYPDESVKSFKKRILKAHDKKRRYYKIRGKVSYSELKKLQEISVFNLGQYKGGLIAEKFDYRKRPYNTLAKRTIGNYNTFTKSYQVGLEGAYDTYLKGIDGVRMKQKTSGGWRPMYLFDETIKEPVNGIDVISTIDIELQDVAESSLYRELVKHKADWGCAILMEVATGQIKAIANLKADTSNKTYIESFNYAIGNATEPGSTFKLATMLVALNDDKVKPTDIIHTGNGEYTYHGKTIHDSHDGGFGDLSVSEVIQHSSNVGFFKIVLGGYEKTPADFIDGIYKLGIHKPLQLDIKGEAKPYIKNPEDKTWSRMSLPWMSIGYELRMTPLQILTLYNAVANDGVMVKPQFVKELRNIGLIQKHFKTEVLNPSIANPQTIKSVQRMLELVIQDGTGTGLKDSPFPIAGKTGTAQIYQSSYNKRNYQASFVGYFPADKPKYSCIVVVNNPKSGQYYASLVAVPVFKDIANKVYATDLSIQSHELKDSVLQAPPSKLGIYEDIKTFYDAYHFAINGTAHESSFIMAVPTNDSLNLQTRKTALGLMPNVMMMTAKDAICLLEEMGLYVEIEGAGKVVEQNIAAGTKIKKGMQAKLKLRF